MSGWRTASARQSRTSWGCSGLMDLEFADAEERLRHRYPFRLIYAAWAQMPIAIPKHRRGKGPQSKRGLDHPLQRDGPLPCYKNVHDELPGTSDGYANSTPAQ